MHDGAGIPLNRSILRLCDTSSGARWGKGAIVTYTKFYVKFRSQITLPYSRGLGNEV